MVFHHHARRAALTLPPSLAQRERGHSGRRVATSVICGFRRRRCFTHRQGTRGGSDCDAVAICPRSLGISDTKALGRVAASKTSPPTASATNKWRSSFVRPFARFVLREKVDGALVALRGCDQRDRRMTAGGRPRPPVVEWQALFAIVAPPVFGVRGAPPPRAARGSHPSGQLSRRIESDNSAIHPLSRSERGDLGKIRVRAVVMDLRTRPSSRLSMRLHVGLEHRVHARLISRAWDLNHSTTSRSTRNETGTFRSGMMSFALANHFLSRMGAASGPSRRPVRFGGRSGHRRVPSQSCRVGGDSDAGSYWPGERAQMSPKHIVTRTRARIVMKRRCRTACAFMMTIGVHDVRRWKKR